MEISALFTGADNSLGYKHGTVYKLKVSTKNKIAITRLNGSGYCTYDSFTSFLNNWDKINLIK